jgi:hypothetical protein
VIIFRNICCKLLSKCLLTLTRNIGWETNFEINGFEGQKFSGFHVPKSKGCRRDLIQIFSFIFFPCVCFWLGKIWLKDSCLVVLSTFGFLGKMNEWKLLWEHVEIHHLFLYMVHVEYVWWFKLKPYMMPSRNKTYFALNMVLKSKLSLKLLLK